jgi:hypothetical protein
MLCLLLLWQYGVSIETNRKVEINRPGNQALFPALSYGNPQK